MINAEILRERNKHIGFRVYGHAGYAKKGNDIICAAVSTITQSIEIGIELSGVKHRKNKLPGKDNILEIMLYETNEQTELIMQILKKTLKEIEQQYPEYLNVFEIRG